MRLISLLMLFLLTALPGRGQPVVTANILADQTRIEQSGERVHVSIGLSKPVPFRVFTLNDPKRLIVDFQMVNWDNLPENLERSVVDVNAIRYGLFQTDWSRLVFDLNAPLIVEQVEISARTGYSVLEIQMRQGGEAEFASAARAPVNGLWRENQVVPVIAGDAGLPLVALDAGHGGIDPGARRGRVVEKDLTLQFAFDLRDALLASGRYRVLMIRETDLFIPLLERVRLARASGADVLLSLHANTVEEGYARGTTVINLSEEASSHEAQALAGIENRADLIAGVALLGEDDEITKVLVEMAQRQTNTLSELLAQRMAQNLGTVLDDGVQSRRMSAGFRVLRAPDIPSLLLELGFMSSPSDLDNLMSPDWRARANRAIIAALDGWMLESAQMRGLLRK